MSKLILAVPSKGRLQEQCQEFFTKAGLKLVQARGSRDYRGVLQGVEDVEVAYLSASEIARELALGHVHLGVTGEDLLRENIPDVDERIAIMTPLGFGHANVVVAVPQAWIDVASMADLDDVAASFRARHGRRLRIATKYIQLTRAFFAQAGITDYRIVESLGATEGAPAAGAAEAIVDITTTGQTLTANALKILDDGVILRSQANLVASLAANWPATAQAALKMMCDRISAQACAREVREVRFAAIDSSRLLEQAQALFQAHLPFGEGGEKAVLHVSAQQSFALVDWLRQQGAGTVTVCQLDYVFHPSNPLWEAVALRLPQG